MAGGGGGTEELNLVPYLDIMVNLIMFMVTVTAYLVQLKEAPILAPTYGPGGGGSGDQKPFITVAIANTEIRILAGGTAQGAIPLKKGDYKGLTVQLHQLRVQIPDMQDNLVITADKAVPYKEVVAVMDAARVDENGKSLFPNVTLAASL